MGPLQQHVEPPWGPCSSGLKALALWPSLGWCLRAQMRMVTCLPIPPWAVQKASYFHLKGAQRMAWLMVACSMRVGSVCTHTSKCGDREKCRAFVLLFSKTLESVVHPSLA